MNPDHRGPGIRIPNFSGMLKLMVQIASGLVKLVLILHLKARAAPTLSFSMTTLCSALLVFHYTSLELSFGFCVSTSTTADKAPHGQGPVVFHLLGTAACEQCLAHSRSSVNTCWMSEC